MGRDPGKIAVRHGDQGAKLPRPGVAESTGSARGCWTGSSSNRATHGAILAGNCIEYLEIVAGAAQAGIPLATVNPGLSPREVAGICDDAEAAGAFRRCRTRRACAGHGLRVRRAGVRDRRRSRALSGRRPAAGRSWRRCMSGRPSRFPTPRAPPASPRACWFRTGRGSCSSTEWRPSTVVIRPTTGSWDLRRCATAAASRSALPRSIWAVSSISCRASTPGKCCAGWTSARRPACSWCPPTFTPSSRWGMRRRRSIPRGR